MATPRSRALRALPLAVAVPLAVPPATGAAAPAAPHTIVRSTYGIDSITAVVAGGRGVAAWSGALRGADIVSAEHRAGTALWPAAVPVSSAPSGGAWGPQVASNAAGDTVAAWMVVDGTSLTIEAARRTGVGTWSALPRLAAIADASSMARADLPRTPLAVDVTPDGTALVAYGTPDGTVTALRLAPGAAAWDAPVVVRGPVAGRPAPDPADLALAAGPDGTATLLWTETAADTTRSIGEATWNGVAWSPPSSLPSAVGGYYPDVDVTAAGEVIAAWTTTDGNFAATRPAGGAWSAATRVGGGYLPEIAVGANRVAVTWGSAGKGVALRDAAGGAWSPSVAPVAPMAAAFDRGDRLVVAGRLPSGVLAWSRRGVNGAWAPARVASRQADLHGASGAAIVPSAAGPLATLYWSGNVRQGRLGMRAGGTVVQGLDISSTTGDVVGSRSVLRLTERPFTVGAYGAVRLHPRFTRYAGGVAVRIQTRRGGRWHTTVGDRADVDGFVAFRVGGPGRIQVRLAYGPGFRRTTNAVSVTVRRTALPRVVAGWSPSAIAASGRDLWVLSGTRTGAHAELRLLDAATGRLRRGPVRVGLNPSSLSLAETGGPVLLDRFGADSRRLDPSLPGLIGAPVTLDAGGCTIAACAPITLTTAGSTLTPSRSVGFTLAPVSGPDGRVWGLGPGQDDEGGGTGATVVESLDGAPPVTRDAHGFRGYHGGFSAELIAVDGGLWFRGAQGATLWVGADGPGVAKGVFQSVRGAGRCVWGLAGNVGAVREIVRLREGGTANAPRIPLRGVSVDDKPPFTVAARTAWVIGLGDQTLVRVPLPAC